ncbi:MAG TPA: lipase maturation factor family protein [Bdellovibrionota bacterium]|nr:lipase maturation factor family protein [Bdellovibrionota bacterium]
MQADYWLTRFWFQRGLGFIYFIGFLILLNQFRALCGENGLLPARLFLKRIDFWDSPSLFFISSSDRFLWAMAALGLLLSVSAMTGLSDAFGLVPSLLVWAALWALYLSFVNIGQTFYGFGWETLLCETGFLAIFLGPTRAAPPVIVIWLLRWILFRLMFGAGLIKIRGDECWRDLTCMKYHYETQPMPNPLSWYFHQQPMWIHKAGVLFTHVVELVVPFLYFGPSKIRHAAGILTIVFQATLILSGNLSWLNYITIVIAIACFDDSILPSFGQAKLFPPLEGLLPVPQAAADTALPPGVTLALAALVGVLSIRPVMNLLSRAQMMNTSFDSLHLVNTYGAFGSITRERYELVIEGSDDAIVTPQTKWREYLFKGKPSEPERTPPVVSPYHLRLDWQMWFAAMSPYRDHPWILNLVSKLLQGDRATLGLVRGNPFGEKPPRHVRVEHYLYRFAPPGSRETWTRTRVASYLPPLSLDQPAFREMLETQGWLPEGATR